MRAYIYTGGVIDAANITERPEADDLVIAADSHMSHGWTGLQCSRKISPATTTAAWICPIRKKIRNLPKKPCASLICGNFLRFTLTLRIVTNMTPPTHSAMIV